LICVLDLEHGDNYTVNMATGEGSITLRSKFLYGDGRYFMSGGIARVDEGRVRKIYLKQSDMPVMKKIVEKILVL